MSQTIGHKLTGWILIAAAICFWTGWALMPGVGVTDAATILQLVNAQPQQVLASSLLQLASAALFALTVPGLTVMFAAFNSTWGRAGAALLAVGACGDAADAIYHQLAYEMVRPGVDQAAMLSVMQRMQSSDLLYLLPMILAFLLGSIALSVSAVRGGIVAIVNPMLYILSFLIAALGSRMPGVSSRFIGLLCLGLLSINLVWIGFAVAGFPSGGRSKSN